MDQNLLALFGCAAILMLSFWLMKRSNRQQSLYRPGKKLSFDVGTLNTVVLVNGDCKYHFPDMLLTQFSYEKQDQNILDILLKNRRQPWEVTVKFHTAEIPSIESLVKKSNQLQAAQYN